MVKEDTRKSQMWLFTDRVTSQAQAASAPLGRGLQTHIAHFAAFLPLKYICGGKARPEHVNKLALIRKRQSKATCGIRAYKFIYLTESEMFHLFALIQED